MIKARVILTVILLALVQNTFTQDRYRVKNAPFSTEKYDEFSPVIVGDKIIYCSNMEDEIFLTYTGMNNKGLFNIFSIKLSDSITMNSPEIFSRNLITPYNDGPASFDSSGTLVAYSRNIDIKSRTKNIFDLNNNLGIYFARLQNGEWTDIEAFVFNDSTYSNTTPWLRGDGKYLYFASNMPGGEGGSDIYRSEKSESGWGTPENIGPNINTKGNEVYPFLTADGKLFFASDGHPGFGKKDIYMSEKIENSWITPIHLESPINGKEDDFSLITDTEFTKGYFSSNRSKSDDIYSFNTIVSQLYNCDTLLENNYCFSFWDDKYPGVDSLPVIYEWEFSDGTITRGLEVEHCFEGAGHYWAKLNIVDNTTSNTFFTQSSMEFDIEDFEQPYITSRDAFLSKEDMAFSGLKSNLPGFTINEYIWEFGERIFATGPETKYNFKKAGTYYVKMGVKGYNEASNKSEIKCVIKPIRIVSDNQALAMILAGIEPPLLERIDSSGIASDPSSPDFSVFEVDPENEVFRVELLQSKDKIMIEDSIFDPLRNSFEIREFYISKDSAYSYTVGEYGSLLETYPVYNEVVENGFSSARVKTYVLAELPTEIIARINRDFAEFADANFEFSESQVSESSYPILNRIVTIMNENPDLVMEIAAHTDNIGSFEFNMELAQKRAESIVKYLIDKGIDSIRLVAKGYGESRPIANNNTEEGRRSNRRVEFLILNNY